MKQQKTINQHEQQYWHIPKFKIGLFLLFLLILGIDYRYSYIFINEWNNHNISYVFNCSGSCSEINISNLGFIPQIFFAYLLISLTFIILVVMIKGGFYKLKNYDEAGLIVGLIAGFIWGLIAGFIWGLIWGLIVGLIVGLIAGFIWGLIAEFEK